MINEHKQRQLSVTNEVSGPDEEHRDDVDKSSYGAPRATAYDLRKDVEHALPEDRDMQT